MARRNWVLAARFAAAMIRAGVHDVELTRRHVVVRGLKVRTTGTRNEIYRSKDPRIKRRVEYDYLVVVSPDLCVAPMLFTNTGSRIHAGVGYLAVAPVPEA